MASALAASSVLLMAGPTSRTQTVENAGSTLTHAARGVTQAAAAETRAAKARADAERADALRDDAEAALEAAVERMSTTEKKASEVLSIDNNGCTPPLAQQCGGGWVHAMPRNVGEQSGVHASCDYEPLSSPAAIGAM
jgi:hypothetical protein